MTHVVAFKIILRWYFKHFNTIHSFSHSCNLFQVTLHAITKHCGYFGSWPCGVSTQQANSLKLNKGTHSLTDRWARVNNCMTGVGVGTWTIRPVHICSALPPPQMRQLLYGKLCRAAPSSVCALSPLLGWKVPQRWWPQSSGAKPGWSLLWFGLPK